MHRPGKQSLAQCDHVRWIQSQVGPTAVQPPFTSQTCPVAHSDCSARHKPKSSFPPSPAEGRGLFSCTAGQPSTVQNLTCPPQHMLHVWIQVLPHRPADPTLAHIATPPLLCVAAPLPFVAAYPSVVRPPQSSMAPWAPKQSPTLAHSARLPIGHVATLGSASLGGAPPPVRHSPHDDALH